MLFSSHVGSKYKEIIGAVLGHSSEAVDRDDPLMGGNAPIDSVALVEICVRLEDLASELGFDFDWTSENALSRSSSIFRTAGTLFDEFQSQMNAEC